MGKLQDGGVLQIGVPESLVLDELGRFNVHFQRKTRPVGCQPAAGASAGPRRQHVHRVPCRKEGEVGVLLRDGRSTAHACPWHSPERKADCEAHHGQHLPPGHRSPPASGRQAAARLVVPGVVIVMAVHLPRQVQHRMIAVRLPAPSMAHLLRERSQLVHRVALIAYNKSEVQLGQCAEHGAGST